jgi:hypothetical protein
MFAWFKSLFFRNTIDPMESARVEERIAILENQMSEVSNVIHKQSALTTIIAGIQCDIVTVLNDNPPPKKITSSDIEEVLMNFSIDDDDFIN